MIKKFEALEGVQGLNKILALSRSDGEMIYCSSSVDNDTAASITKNFMLRINALPAGVSHLTINLLSGRILFYFIRDHLLVLFVDSRFDVNELRSRLKEASAKLKEKPVRISESLEELEKIPVSEDQLKLLANAMYAVSSQAYEELGVFVSVNALKQVRESLLDEFRVLYSFTVNKDGEISIQKDAECSSAEAAAGIAAWILTFFRRCNDIVPTFPPELTIGLLESHRQDLEEIGFYKVWTEVKSKLTE